MKIQTTGQRWVLIAGTALIAVMTLFPPWTHTFKSKTNHSEKPAGYSFIATPPAPKRALATDGVRLDIPRLSVQTVAVTALVALGLLLISEGHRIRNSTTGLLRRVAALKEFTRARWQRIRNKETRSGRMGGRGDPVIDPRAFDGLVRNHRGINQREDGYGEKFAGEPEFIHDTHPKGIRLEPAPQGETKAPVTAGEKHASARLPDREIEKIRKHISTFKHGTSRSRHGG